MNKSMKILLIVLAVFLVIAIVGIIILNHPCFGNDIIPVEYGKDTDFAVGDFNILEPQNEPYTGNFDLIVVHGVAFDRQGNRLGRGKGYYDRFLCQHLKVKRIGICFDFQLVDSIPTEPFDIRMDEVITL